MLNLIEQDYCFEETFDTNLTADYEVESWNEWHIVREFISNALDGVGGNPQMVSIKEDEGTFVSPITARDTHWFMLKESEPPPSVTRGSPLASSGRGPSWPFLPAVAWG